jgi:hypothetical protein
MTERDPTLERFDALVGTWVTEATHPLLDAADRESTARPRHAADGDMAVDGVVRRDPVGDADAFGALPSTYGLRRGTAQHGRRHIELVPRDNERTRPRLRPRAPTPEGSGFRVSAPGRGSIATKWGIDLPADDYSGDQGCVSPPCRSSSRPAAPSVGTSAASATKRPTDACW